MQNKNVLIILVAVLILGGVGLGVFMMRQQSNNPSVTSTPLATIVGQPTVRPTVSPITEDTTGIAEVKVVSVEAGSFYYKPNEIKVKKGQKVKIELASVSMMHDFVIDELGVKVPVTPSGKTGTVEFTADTVGKFTFYCSVGNHRQMGQVGTLIVE